jgi:peptide/nickel transport system ATP-binding protein
MIFQEPMSSLNPVHRIGYQIMEALCTHRSMPRSEARARALELLTDLGVPSPEKCLVSYPHQLSGGMRQRVMIAMALSGKPALLIADEPTTALDVTVQAQILDLIMDLQEEFQAAVIIITHDLGVVAEISDDILVMYAGRPVEKGSAAGTFGQPSHPYTWGLLGSMPLLGVGRADRLRPIPGTPPSLINVPSGCPFHPRCTYTERVSGDACSTVVPDLTETAPLHLAACHLPVNEQRAIWAALSSPEPEEEPDPDSDTTQAQAAADEDCAAPDSASEVEA